MGITTTDGHHRRLSVLLEIAVSIEYIEIRLYGHDKSECLQMVPIRYAKPHRPILVGLITSKMDDKYHVLIMQDPEVCIGRGSIRIGRGICFVSCNNGGHPRRRSPQLWEHMAASPPSICVHMGDNCYMDYGNDTLNECLQCIDEWEGAVNCYRSAYVAHWSTPHMQRILSSCSNVMLWDDHDVCDSWDQDESISMLKHLYDPEVSWQDIAIKIGNPRATAIIAAIQAYCEYQLPLNQWCDGWMYTKDGKWRPGSSCMHLDGRYVLMLDRRSSKALGTPLIPPITYHPEVVVMGVPFVLLPPIISNRYVHSILSIFGIKDMHDQWIMDRDDMRQVMQVILEAPTVPRIIGGDAHMCGMTTISVPGYGDITQITASAMTSPPPPRMVLWILRLMSRWSLRMDDMHIKVVHNAWTRRNGYAYLDPSGAIEIVLG